MMSKNVKHLERSRNGVVECFWKQKSSNLKYVAGIVFKTPLHVYCCYKVYSQSIDTHTP